MKPAKRRIEIDCPQDCVYLGEHAAGWEGRESERRRDMLRIAPFAQALDETQAQMFFLALVGVTAIRSQSITDDTSPNKRDQIWYDMLKAAMTDFNKQMESEIRQNFGAYLVR